MSTMSPPVLLQLAIESLLNNKELAIEATKDLPREIFPSMFMEAFIRGHAEVMKAMVLSWPFPSLPLGTLMNLREEEFLHPQEDKFLIKGRILQAVLDGLDMLLSQKVCSRRMKLQVLDMRDTPQNFWRVWARNELEACSSEATKRTKTEETGTSEQNEKALSVLLDLQISHECPCSVASCLLKWIQERKDLVQLECKVLCVTNVKFPAETEVIKMLNFDSVQEVVLGHNWSLIFLADFAPFLGRMQNLHKLTLSDISAPIFMHPEETEQLVTKIASQFLELNSLKEIYMDFVSFLTGRLHHILRCLTSPLETLSVTHCHLCPSDWDLLPHFVQTRQLKCLVLSCINLGNFSPEPLRILLDNISTTLTTLDLENCWITDAQVCAFLPSLSSCSKLTTFCFVRNFISMGTMQNLLSHTARMSNLTLELYSPPQEIPIPRAGALEHIQSQIDFLLRRMMRPLNHPRRVWFCIHQERCCNRKIYHPHHNPCPSCVPI